MQITVGELRSLIRESLIENIDEGFMDSAKKFVKMLPLLTVSLSAVACGPDNPNTFNTDGFTEEELIVIKDAADEICEKSNGKGCVMFGEEGDSTLKIAAEVTCSGNSLEKDRRFSACSNINPKTRVSNITVRANREDPDWLLKLHDTVQHELLHHLRNDRVHLPAGNRLAAHKEEQGAYVTDLDVQGIR